MRGLQSVCTWTVLHLKSGDRITMAKLPPTFKATLNPAMREGRSQAARVRVGPAIAAANGNKSEAARSLNISRTQLYRELNRERRTASG